MLKLRLCYIVYCILVAVSLGAQSHKRFSFAHYGTSAGLAANDVFAATQDRQGFIWVGTTNGLQRYDGIRFMTFTHKKNDPTTIPGNFVSQLLMDAKDNLWIQSAGDRVGIFDIKKFSYQDVAIHASNELSACGG